MTISCLRYTYVLLCGTEYIILFQILVCCCWVFCACCNDILHRMVKANFPEKQISFNMSVKLFDFWLLHIIKHNFSILLYSSLWFNFYTFRFDFYIFRFKTTSLGFFWTSSMYFFIILIST